jgi:hypothetical protein
MTNNKVLILLPDGIGLRNFAYTDFYRQGKENGFDIVFWNNTPFDLTELGFEQIRISGAKNHPLTDMLKNARISIELSRSTKKENDTVYDSYRFPLSYRNVKTAMKSLIVRWFSFRYNSDKGLKKLSRRIAELERKTPYYRDCLETLKREKPAFVFCTNQRITLAISPILAAKELGIPTATFIFSWDNLPKATKVIETDYYFVWSEHMKSELRFYYPDIRENQVFVTGTPQFELHFDHKLILPKEDFYSEYGLDPEKKYICFSGDDFVTSPHDQHYLADVANAVRELNERGQNLGIIFRRCPVDFSSRYDDVLEKNQDIIRVISPKWGKLGQGWNTVLPTKDDNALLANTVRHTELVVNLGSSMVFDYAAQGKPCAFLNYDVTDPEISARPIEKIYKFVHFRTMPDRKAVFWLNKPEEISAKLGQMITGSPETVGQARKWFEKITLHPPQAASARIWKSIQEIISKS